MRDENPLSVVFQPVVELTNGKILGYEALGRLRGREKDGFAPLLQWTREHRRITAVYRQLQTMALSAGRDRPPKTLLFLNMRLSDLAALPREKIDWSSVVLEVPESDGRLNQWERGLAPWRGLGAQVAIDDWGVGAADPMRLIQLKPDWIKIDVALIRRIGEADADRLIELLVRYTKPTTHLIAEGIETPKQLDRLRQLGVRYGQGFVLAQPRKAWPTEVVVPRVEQRVRLQRTALALGEALVIRDEDLTLIEEARPTLTPLIASGIDALVRWIDLTMMRHHMRVARERYRTVLTHHFDQLTRGTLDMSDVARAHQIARAHQRYGVDLSFYVAGYRELQAVVAKQLRQEQLTALADAMRALFSWDMTMVMEAYQELLDRDSLTGVLSRQAFWDRVARDVEEAGGYGRQWILGVIELDGFQSIAQRQGLLQADRLLAEVGQIFQAFMTTGCLVGRIGGDEFGLWFPHSNLQAIRREFRAIERQIAHHLPEVTLLVGLALLGRDGDSLERLYQTADRRLARSRIQQHV
ncbi:MAG: EAL domain-containing protein [Firmicutes bacterium]|nr:EAL domain-containing protein [Bacillota bacterium]